MKETLLVLLLLLFMVSTNKILLIPITLVLIGFFIYKKKYNIALGFLLVLFVISLVFNNRIETFQDNTTSAIKDKIKTSTTQALISGTNGTTQSSNDNEEIEREVIDSGDITIGLKDYNEIFFILNALLEENYAIKNNKYLRDIITDYKIYSIFDLSKKVLNKDKNPLYNNFLEKITCREDNGIINYLNCDSNNYKKLYAFCELLLVYTLDLDNIIKLINVHKIMRVCELSAKRSVLDQQNNNTIYEYELLGLTYYLNEKTFARKYYDILQLLELDTFLANDPGTEHLTLREKLYNYNNSNRKVVKDLNSIMVLFDYYSIFDKYVLNLEDDDYNWNLGILKSVDLNFAYWDTITFFKEYKVKERIIITINRLTSVDDEFLNRGRNPSNPFSNSNSLNTMANSNINDEGYEEEEDLFKTSLKTFGTRYKNMVDKKKKEQKEQEVKLDKKLNLNHIKENFNKTMIDIIDDCALLVKRKCDLDCDDTSNPLFARFMFYTGELFKIITKKERMLYVGILLVLLSIIFNFIIASR